MNGFYRKLLKSTVFYELDSTSQLPKKVSFDLQIYALLFTQFSSAGIDGY